MPNDWRNQLFKKEELVVKGANGNTFYIKVRSDALNPLDFSVILTVLVPLSNRHFRLRRYNGASHEHKNRIEDKEIDGFHIHYATARYQLIRPKPKEDGYAQPTNRYNDLESALRCLIEDANFEQPSQQELF